MRKSGDRLRITTQLVNIADGYQLWSERYDRELTDVFDVQDEISLAVVSQLKVELLGQEKASTTKRTMSDVNAYNLCLLGRHHWYTFTKDGMKAAQGHFEQALKLAPDSARVHAGLADLYLAKGGGAALNLSRGIDVLPKAKFHAEKAIALDPSLGNSYGTLGLMRTWFEWDWTAAEQVMNRAVEIEPSSAGGYICRSYYLTVVGRHEEAITDVQRGIELDPVSPILFHIAGWHYYYAGQSDEVLEYYARATDLAPDFAPAQVTAGLVSIQNGKLNEAISRFKLARSQWPRLFGPLLGYAYAQAGQRPAAMQVLQDVEEKIQEGWASATELALIHLGLGENDKALDQLEVAIEEPPFARSFYLAYLKVERIWNPLRSDPRFQAIIARMNFPKSTN